MKKIKSYYFLFILIALFGVLFSSCGGDDDNKSEPAVEICDNALDDDGDGFTDCEDFECDCQVEICDNAMDDDGDGFTDCEDADCNCP